ncbi:hypothetical protein [Treponema primitia]|uniref:hypothetical protein n=1 Tax=Treponema primitia TaxID=88058 RepID=UPI000255587B|nr:hypothetical protein [Treponema primitia]
MGKIIYIIYDKADVNASLAKLLESALNETGTYTVNIQTKSEYEGENLKYELLGTAREDGAMFIFAGKINDILFDKIQWRYDEFGMKYGWDGNNALLYTEKRKWSEAELSELAKLFGNTTPENSIKKGLSNIGGKINKLPAGLKIAGAIGGAALFGAAAMVAAGSAFLINGKINNDKIFENQQKYLVKIFCEQAITDFTGEI